MDGPKDEQDDEKEPVVGDNLHEVIADASKQDIEGEVNAEGEPNDPDFFNDN